MKAIYIGVLSAMVLALSANCAKKDDGPKATATMSSGCFMLQMNTYSSQGRTICNFNYSAYAASAGFSNFDSTRGYQYSSTNMATMLSQGCQSYSQPVYSETKGLGCVDSRNLNYYGTPAYYTLDTNGQTFVLGARPISTNQYGQLGWNMGYGYSSATAAYSGAVLRVCDSSEPCPSGLVCRSPYTDTTLGVCYY